MLGTVLRKAEGIFHRHARVGRLANLVGTEKKTIKSFIDKIEQDSVFFGYIKNKMKQYLDYTPSKHDFIFTSKTGSIFFPCVTIYSFVRAINPKIVVETGGTPGKSSAAILYALEENKAGHLYTLDLPPQETNGKFSASHFHSLRPADEVSCWAINPTLRTKHSLILGDTKKTLPPLLDELDQIDIFIHDSDHSYNHMMFEFTTSWNRIKPNGFLVSDDIRTNNSFTDFAKLVSKKPQYLGNYGILCK